MTYYFWLGIDAEKFHEFDRMLEEDFEEVIKAIRKREEMRRRGYW